MRNKFEIIINGKKFEAYNSVIKAYDYWLNGYAYAAYMCVFGENEKIYKVVEIVDFNENVNMGKLFATYKIDISVSEFPHKIKGIGLAPYEGAELSNACYISLPAADATIFATVYLETTTKDFSFYPGENHLIRSLLGLQPMQDLTVKASRLKIPSYSALIAEGDDISSGTEMDGNGFRVDFDPLDYSDFLIMCAFMPCAHFNLAHFNNESMFEDTQSNGGFFVPDAISVDSVEVDSIGVDFGAFHTVSELIESGGNVLNGFDGYELFSDPLYKYAGLKNGSKYYLVDGETLSVDIGGSYSGEIFLCTNGAVVIADGGKITFPDGEVKTVVDGKTVVLYRDGGYDIFVYATPELYIYRYDGDLVLTKSIEVGEGETERLSDCAVIFKTQSSKTIYTFKGEVSFAYDGFSNLTDEDIKDMCFYGNGYMGDVFSGERIICEKASGRFGILKGELYYVGAGGAKKLKDNFDFDSATIAGSAAMFLHNGRLTFYRIVSNGMFVSIPFAGIASYCVHKYGEIKGMVKLMIKN